MSFVTYQNRDIFYETIGEPTNRPPLVMLNGIMMSTVSWKLLANELSVNRQIILVDFVDQGQSHKAESESYTHDLQVDIIIHLMKTLKHEKIDLLGISYGGQIGLQVAIKAPSLIHKLAIFNAAAYTTPWLRDIGRAWVKMAKTYDSEGFYLVTIPYIYSNTFYTEHIDWMESRKKLLLQIFNEDFMDAMVRLIDSSEGYDIRKHLEEIKCPTLIVGSDSDYLTPPNQTRALSSGIKHSIYMEIANCGHASMYEKAGEFLMLLDGFLNMNTEMNMIK